MPGGVDAWSRRAGRYHVAAAEFVRQLRGRDVAIDTVASSPYSGIVAALFLVDFTGAAVAKSRCPNPMATLTTTTMSELRNGWGPKRSRSITHSGAGGPLAVSWSTSAQGMPQVHQAVGRGDGMLSQRLRAHYNRGILYPTDRDVEPIPVEQERSRVEHRRRTKAVIEMKTTGACPPWNLSTVPTVLRTKSGRRQPPTDQRHLSVVRREQAHRGAASGRVPCSSITARAEQLPQLVADRLGLFGAFDRIALVVHAHAYAPRGYPSRRRTAVRSVWEHSLPS